MQITPTLTAAPSLRRSPAPPAAGPRDTFSRQEVASLGLMPRLTFTPAVQADLAVVDGEKDGRYGRIEGTVDGRDVRLEMTREPHYVKVGGIMFETDPTYRIEGGFAGLPVALSVQPDPQVSDIGGLKVQTGTIYHVDGRIDGKAVRLDVTETSHIADVGGIKVETGTTVHLRGEGVSIDVNRETETETVGNGLQVEKRSWWTARGDNLDLELDGLRRDDRMTAKGTASTADLALLYALRPFIAAS